MKDEIGRKVRGREEKRSGEWRFDDSNLFKVSEVQRTRSCGRDCVSTINSDTDGSATTVQRLLVHTVCSGATRESSGLIVPPGPPQAPSLPHSHHLCKCPALCKRRGL